MAAVSGDRRFEATKNDIRERKIAKMEDWLTRALDNATEKGIEKGIEQGMEQGIEREMDKGMAIKFVFCAESLMGNKGYTKEQTCSILNSTVIEYEDAKKLLADVPAGEFC